MPVTRFRALDCRNWQPPRCLESSAACRWRSRQTSLIRVAERCGRATASFTHSLRKHLKEHRPPWSVGHEHARAAVARRAAAPFARSQRDGEHLAAKRRPLHFAEELADLRVRPAGVVDLPPRRARCAGQSTRSAVGLLDVMPSRARHRTLGTCTGGGASSASLSESVLYAPSSTSGASASSPRSSASPSLSLPAAGRR